MQPKVTMQRVPAQIAKQLVATPEQSPFFKPMQEIAAGIGEKERARFTTAAKAAIADSVLPAFQRFEKFFTGEYLPACLDGVGAWRLPEGEAMYAFAARTFTAEFLALDGRLTLPGGKAIAFDPGRDLEFQANGAAAKASKRDALRRVRCRGRAVA